MSMSKPKFVLILALALTGCASVRDKNIPTWNSDDDQTSLAIGALMGAVIGGLGGAVLGNAVGITGGAIGIFDRPILLSPQALLELFNNSLQQKPPNSLSSLNVQPLSLKASAKAPSLPEPPKLTSEWSIADSNEGQITTDWKSIPGKQAGLLWWKKHYQTEVRHIITVRASSTNKDLGAFSIKTEIRERPNENYSWAEGYSELGRKSFERLRDFLLATIEAEQRKIKAEVEQQNDQPPQTNTATRRTRKHKK
jgi:hypothetical protein